MNADFPNTPSGLWTRFRRHYCYAPSVEVGIDISRMRFGDRFFDENRTHIRSAFAAMRELESGAIANPDEQRRVGHYWLRAPELAPTPEIREEIESALARVKAFAADVHAGRVRPEKAERFRRFILIGIGGSALGPQLLADALGGPEDRLKFHSLDNTDPDGFDRLVAGLGNALPETLTLVISKSGGTKETRNGMLEVSEAYRAAGLSFARHTVAVTQSGSKLDQEARGWLTTFPMWDWVGGRTSVTSAVGLLPAALQGIDIDAFLAGARAMDVVTRVEETGRNPAALLALMWHHAGRGTGSKDMVVLPYKDRLLLFSRYLQQLVMESLGKEKDREGRTVHQGIAVYGNKGSTDQHAYVQQLRDGLDNFFATFIEVKEDRPGGRPSPVVDLVEAESPQPPGGGREPAKEGVTSGDFLGAFLQGTRQALTERRRESITIDLRRMDAAGLGKLIALFERAVGLYASLIHINAYHQPGVEAGKVAAESVLKLQAKLVSHLRRAGGKPRTLDELAREIGELDRAELLFRILEKLSANPDRGVLKEPGADPFSARYAFKGA